MPELAISPIQARVMSRVALAYYTAISSFALTTGQYQYCPVVRAKLDIALWSGLYVIYNPVVSFDLRCQSGK